MNNEQKKFNEMQLEFNIKAMGLIEHQAKMIEKLSESIKILTAIVSNLTVSEKEVFDYLDKK